jgi:peptide deformylase
VPLSVDIDLAHEMDNLVTLREKHQKLALFHAKLCYNMFMINQITKDRIATLSEQYKQLVKEKPEAVRELALSEIPSEQEGCLSVDSVYGLVPRWSKVRVKAIDINGHEVRIKSPNPFIARILQHEIDHTNGICFVDHIAKEKAAFSILRDDGELEPYAYNKVVDSGILPDD